MNRCIVFFYLCLMALLVESKWIIVSTSETVPHCSQTSCPFSFSKNDIPWHVRHVTPAWEKLSMSRTMWLAIAVKTYLLTRSHLICFQMIYLFICLIQLIRLEQIENGDSDNTSSLRNDPFRVGTNHLLNSSTTEEKPFCLSSSCTDSSFSTF